MNPDNSPGRFAENAEKIAIIICSIFLLCTGEGICIAIGPQGEGTLVISRSSSRMGPCMKEMDLRRRMLRQINSARAKARYCGNIRYPRAGSLTWNSRLAQAAFSHSRDMAFHEMFSHRGSDNSVMADRIKAAGYRARAMGENLARGQKDVAGAVRSWMKSPSHCANIMLPEFTELGASCTVDQSGRKYWTLILAAPF